MKKQEAFIKVRSTYVVGGLALSIFAMLVLVLVIVVCISGLKSCREFFGQSPTRYPPPSSMQIVVVDGETSTDNVVLDAETNSLIRETLAAIRNAVEMKDTDRKLLEGIKNNMDCGGGKEPVVSDYIHFKSGDSSLGPIAKNRIDEFVCRVGDQATKWRVFGFASESGRQEHNRKLSWKRACEATKRLCGLNDLDCKKYDPNKRPTEVQCRDKPVVLFEQGEEHFINGAANSRSVVIAACRAVPGEAGTDGKPDTVIPSCSASE